MLFLFAIVVDTLTRLITKAQESNLVKGFKIGRNGVLVFHLQIVDDTILFCEARDPFINDVRVILKCFEKITGLRVNLEKTKFLVEILQMGNLRLMPKL